MMGCDGTDCEMDGFHIECTGITAILANEEAW
jgi:hypothetical protein